MHLGLLTNIGMRLAYYEQIDDVWHYKADYLPD